MKTIKVGLTGGIGSGKSTVAEIFSTLGVPVYTADTEAKRIMHDNNVVKEKIKSLFGKNAYNDKGELNSKWISGQVFKDKSLLNKLNSIVHPAVQEDAEQWFHNQSTAYAIEEAAILIESGGYKLMDKIIVVHAAEEVRIKRVVDRDQSNYENVKSRMDNQLSSEERLKYADYVIDNDGDRLLIPQVKEIDEKLRNI